MISEALQRVIGDYLSRVENGVSLLKKKTDYEHPLRAWGNKKIPQYGELSDTIEYEFHGIGCVLIFPDCEVDFGPEDRIDGFDLWRLNKYLTSCPDKYLGYNAEDLKSDFELAVEKREIGKLGDPNCNLYYCN